MEEVRHNGQRAPRAMLALMEVLESRYEDLSAHGEMVAHYCGLIGRELSLAPAEVHELRLAGALHDVGKVGVDEAILLKPGGLTELEWRQVRKHPQIGADLLFSANLDRIAGWVLAHHERPDGRGYPYGNPRDLIPLPALILAVADAYDAMLTSRVYKAALTPAAAAAELRREAGGQFDSGVVAAFLRSLEREQALDEFGDAAATGS